MRVNTRYINSTRGTASKSSGYTSLVELMYFVFTCMPGKSNWRQLRFLLLCLCDIFQALINSLVKCVDFARVLWALLRFIFSKTRVIHFKATPYRVIVQVDKFWCLRTSKLLELIWSCSNPKCPRSSDLPSFSYEIEPTWRVWILMPGKFKSAPLHPHNWT